MQMKKRRKRSVADRAKDDCPIRFEDLSQHCKSELHQKMWIKATLRRQNVFQYL